ncbi:MAG: glycosyltransferase family 1 protein [Candidatus Sulfotelmatobacter sp.]
MTHIFINALSASAGGGLTYVRNVIPCLASREDARATILVPENLRAEIDPSDRVKILAEEYPQSLARRFFYEQRVLPAIIRASGADVLLCTGNFALFSSPVRQILLSRNALYLSKDFLRDLRRRRDYRLWADTKIKGAFARWSVRAADCTVAPSEAFARDLQQWAGKPVTCIYHGFNPQAFFRRNQALPNHAEKHFNATAGAFRILFVSHYNYYRNFETLLRAIAIIRKELYPRPIRLILTCKLAFAENPGSYRADRAASLVAELGVRDEVIELGVVPYTALHNLYRDCDVYATPAYAETFAHPLVEAMASGLPVIASDLAVHREICGDAALYFPCFSPEDLAHRIMQVSSSDGRRQEMREMGLRRSEDFSWDKHVDQLLQLARHLSENPRLFSEDPT